MIKVEKINEVHLRVLTDPDIAHELSEFFTFDVEGAKFSPQYRAKIWDGKKRLFCIQRKTLYVGLLSYLISFAERNNYPIEISSDIVKTNDITLEEVKEYTDWLNLQGRGNPIEVRDYQYDAIHHALVNNRALLLSPTACLSGDTLIEAEVLNSSGDHTFLELYNHYNAGKTIRLNTPHGLKNVIGAYRKYGPGCKISFTDGSTMQGANNHLILHNDEFVSIESLLPNTAITGVDSVKIVKSNESVGEDFWYDFSLDYEHECYIQNGLVHHNSGKSLIIYTILRHHVEAGRKCLLIVPTVSLVMQMIGDFKDYSSANGWSVDHHCQELYAGFSKDFDKDVLVSTWQSIYKQPKAWFEQYDVIIGDECLHPDTIVSTLNGAKKISNLEVGEEVLTRNEDTNELQYKKIIKVHKNISVGQKMYKVTTRQGNHLKITGNHKVMTRRGWVRADELRLDDEVDFEF